MLRTKVITLLLGLIILATFPHFVSADLQFRVTKVQAWVTENNYKGECPHSFEFRASITVNKAGTVKYKWIRSHNQLLVRVLTLKFTKPGTKTVKSYWELGEAGNKYSNYWKKVEIIAPNSMVSNKATFNLECTMAAKTEVSTELFPYSIGGNVNSGPDIGGCNAVGRKVKILLRQGGRTISSLVKSLGTAMGYDSYLEYRFKVRLPGNYYITVKQGPSDSENYSCTDNLCFDRTIPTVCSVWVNSSRKESLNNNFIIKTYVSYVRLGEVGECWIP
jgi:hypothetical protein